jgi:hypothetical protein
MAAGHLIAVSGCRNGPGGRQGKTKSYSSSQKSQDVLSWPRKTKPIQSPDVKGFLPSIGSRGIGLASSTGQNGKRVPRPVGGASGFIDFDRLKAGSYFVVS